MYIEGIKDSEIRMIHEQTLHILEHVGVDFENEEILELFKSKGIRVENQRVFFDPKTVEEALKEVPASFELKTPGHTLKIGEGGMAIASSAGARTILKDGELCTPTIEDYISGRKLDETSEVINLICAPFVNVAQMPGDKMPLIKMALTLKYTSKPVISFCVDKKSAEETIEFVKEFYGAEDGMYTIGVGNVISPLRYSEDDVEAILAYTRRNLPVVITCCSMPGMTSPITLGGSIVQNNAEVLAGIIMTQLVNPGAPVVYGNLTFSADMRKAMPVSWGPEVAVFMRYAKKMADYYHMPCRIGGSLSGAKQLDWQDGAETAVSLMTSIDCGSNFIFHSCGELDCLNVFSFEKYVLDEELLAARLSVENREFITEENIHMDSIENVGPGGNYLLEDETIELYRSELFLPKLFNSENYQSWKSEGMPSVIAKANQLVEQRVQTYQMPDYDERQKKMLADVLEGL